MNELSQGEFPRLVPRPSPEDIVQVEMTEEMARRFEERCLGHHTVSKSHLAGPVIFSEDDVPTYIIASQMDVIYAGIGSRATPEEILELMEAFARKIAPIAILRSGGAPGADSAFERGADRKEVYLPWKGFNGSQSPLYEPSARAMEIAAEFHPRWSYLTQGAKKLMGRNTHQVLGADCETPADVVICWTPGAKGKGGTGQAIRIAKAYEIGVWDLADPEVEEAVRWWLRQ